MARKPNPSKVHGKIALQALDQAQYVNDAFTQYIILHFRITGNLAPGCDMRDFSQWLRENAAEAYATKVFVLKLTSRQRRIE